VPPPIKIAELEVKNRHESAEKTFNQNFSCVLLLLFFEVIKYVQC